MSIEDKVGQWIRDAFERGASDIHFEPDKGGKMRVRFRVDGQVRTVETSDDSAKIISRLKIMAELDVNEKAVPQDGRIKADKWVKGVSNLDLRMSTLPCMAGEKIVLRLIDNRKLNMQLEELGFTSKMLQRYKPLVTSPNGLILHVGPTGSGKTTSLYAVVQTLKKGDINIQTAEDPVEYDVFGITQTAVDHEQGLTFPRVLRALLRQDPDVILVGEIRDGETATIAVEAAMTGHLVLSTLHTNDAVGTVVRLLDMGVPPFCIAYALRCVVSQRFVRKLCDKCRRSAQPDAAAAKVMGSNRPIYAAQGCANCNKQGFKGRVPLFEFLPSSPALRRAVYGNVTPDALSSVARQNGLISLWEDGLDKVWQGLTALSEVVRVVKSDEATSHTHPPRPAAKPRPAAPPPARPAGGAARRTARPH
ncbi:MAG: GspE/PulE family protein [Planctomycetota bacterium]